MQTLSFRFGVTLDFRKVRTGSQWHSGVRSAKCLRLLDFNDAVGSRGPNLLDAVADTAGELEQRLGVGAVLALEGYRVAGVSALADVRIHLDLAQKREGKLFSCA